MKQETSYTDRKASSDLFVRGNAVGVCESCFACPPSRKDLGKFTHTFSHLRHHLLVESIKLRSQSSQGCNECSLAKNVSWMTEAELNSHGLTKSMLTCLKMAKGEVDSNNKGNPRKVRKLPQQSVNQKSLKEFFVK